MTKQLVCGIFRFGGVLCVFFWSYNSVNATQYPASKVFTSKARLTSPGNDRSLGPTVSTFSLLNLIGATKSSTNRMIGAPTSCDSNPDGLTCEYKRGITSNFRHGHATQVTVSGWRLPYAEQSILRYGVHGIHPSFANANVIRWETKGGEIGMFPRFDGFIDVVITAP